jgi:hypothetical protein
MKLLCINDQTIETPISRYDGKGLKLGFMYTTYRPVYKNAEGLDCYFIEELREGKLVERFTDILECIEGDLKDYKRESQLT